MANDTLGDILTDLFATIESRKGAHASDSYTALLLEAGPEKCAKKFGEEALEAALEGAAKNPGRLAEEAADVFYHLFVLMASVGVTPDDVAAILVRRQGVSGHDEKASRKK